MSLPFHVDNLGIPRPLGNFPSSREFLGYMNARADEWDRLEKPAIDKSKWIEFDIWEASGIKIKDQDGKGACNGHAAATSLECARYVAGAPFLELSAWYVYSILCGGIDRGSNIGDALSLLTKQGTCLDSSLEYATINPRKISDAAKTEAGRFKIQLGEMLRTPDDIMEAVQRRQPFNLAVAAGPAFSRLDSEGVPGLVGFCNHAVCCWGGAKKSSKHGWLIRMINSWSTKWGQDGCCWLPVERLPNYGGFEAYTVYYPMDDPQDRTRPTPPTVVI